MAGMVKESPPVHGGTRIGGCSPCKGDVTDRADPAISCAAAQAGKKCLTPGADSVNLKSPKKPVEKKVSDTFLGSPRVKGTLVCKAFAFIIARNGMLKNIGGSASSVCREDTATFSTGRGKQAEPPFVLTPKIVEVHHV